MLSPLRVGEWELPNRVLMAPLTRCRAGPGNVVWSIHERYYAQRARRGEGAPGGGAHAAGIGAGLILSEATQICPEGQGYPNTPGIHSAEQVAGWKRVTDAVHRVGGRIVLQLWHVGRVSHQAYQPGGALPVAPSAIAREGMCRLPDGRREPAPVPRALETDEVGRVIEKYAEATRLALAAGFDGVQVHGANTYLPEQFLRDSTNRRTDRYGGSLENRARFLLEATDACIDVAGSARVSVRLSPSGWGRDFTDSDPVATYSFVVRELDRRNLGFLEIREADEEDTKAGGPDLKIAFFRPLFRGVLVANTDYTRERADEAISKGWCDAVAFGRPMISNPDLVRRFARREALAPWDTSTFYPAPGSTDWERGYIDYPDADGRVA